MSRIKVEKVYGLKWIGIRQKNYSFAYMDTEGKKVPSRFIFERYKGRTGRGRFLEISNRNDNGELHIRLNGNQINTLIRILEEAGEVYRNVPVDKEYPRIKN